MTAACRPFQLLQDQIFHPPAVRKIPRRKDIAKKCHGLGKIALQSPHPEDHLLPGLPSVPTEAGSKLNPDPPIVIEILVAISS